MQELNSTPPTIPPDLGTNASAWDAAALPALANTIAFDTAATFTDPFITGGVPPLDLSAHEIPAEAQDVIKAHSVALADWLKDTSKAAIANVAATPGYLTHWFEAAIEAGRAEVRRTGLNDTGDVPVLSFHECNSLTFMVMTDGSVTLQMDGVARFFVAKANIVQILAGDDSTVLYDNRRRNPLTPMAVEASHATAEIDRLASWLIDNASGQIEGSAVDTALKMLAAAYNQNPAN
jgi:hypothetical protein